MKVRIRALALADVGDGRAFYESQGESLGDYFVDSVFADIASLALYGGIHRRIFGAHRLLCRTFPFAVYYDIVGDTAEVKAVLDCRREPRWIRAELKREGR